VLLQKIFRIFTIIVISITTLCLLLGGTYFYQKFIYTDPLEKTVQEMKEVEVFQVEQRKDRLLIDVQFSGREKLQSSFYLLLDQLERQKKFEKNKLVIKINNAADEETVEFLKLVKLPVYEAISTGHFTDLPNQLMALAEKTGITYDLEIDNQFIFVTAHKKGVSAHLVISRGELPFKVITTMGEEYL